MPTHTIGSLTLGEIPRVVGTISTEAVIKGDPHAILPLCDIAEVRLDHVMSKDEAWLEHCWGIETLACPVIATLRLKREGGAWTRPDDEREPILKKALEHVSCVDVELSSGLVPELGRLADELKKPLVVSYHNFHETPPLDKLQDIARRASYACDMAIPKIATMIQTEADIEVLKTLLAGFKTPICLIGMGPLGAISRTQLPMLGAALAYGCIDEVIAPGQLTAKELVAHFRQHLPAYDKAYKDRTA